MRVTDRLHYESAAKNGAAARSRLQEAAQEAASGIRVSHPGDDPHAAAQIVRHAANAQRAGDIARQLGVATDELQAADGALEGVGNVLSRARELTVQMANGNYTAVDRANAAKEVQGLFQEALGLMNTKAGHRYLFGGFQDQAPPYDATGSYVGDTGVRQVEVAPGKLVDASIRSDVALKGVGGGTDVFATLTALNTALAANDVAGVQNALTGLDAGIQQVASARSQAGSSMSAFDVATYALQALKTEALGAQAHLQEADAIEANTRLAQATQALDAALTASARTFGLTLLDKL